MANLHNKETKVIIGEIGTLTSKKCGDWHSYQKYYGKFHHMSLKYTSAIIRQHIQLLIVIQSIERIYK